jgi:hypothetical protein
MFCPRHSTMTSRAIPESRSVLSARETRLDTTMKHAACGSLDAVAKNYYAGLVATDENVGRILDYLEKKISWTTPPSSMDPITGISLARPEIKSRAQRRG